MILLAVSAVLLIGFVIIAVKYFMLRSEVRSFRKQLSDIRTGNREQPIMVASFSAPSVDMAKEINLLVEKLRIMVKNAEENERRIRVIMAGVSHDFRTPLTSIDGYLQLINDIINNELNVINSKNFDDNELREYLGIVYEKVRYLKELSDDFFEITYLQAREKPDAADVRFDILLSEEMLASYHYMEERHIEVRPDIPEEPIVIPGEEHYVKRIIENLFSNAKKYALTYIYVSVEMADGNIIFKIKNDISHDISIDPEHIFDPFYSAGNKNIQGTGLGLYVCKELSEYMGFMLSGTAENDTFEIVLKMPEFK